MNNLNDIDTIENQAALVEAVLILEVEPIDEATLVKMTKLSKSQIATALKFLIERNSADEYGILPVKIADGWSFSPKKHLWDMLKSRYGKRREDRLSRAALETLAIVAYSQPITRAELENLRGVGSENMLRMLKEKNFIAEVARKEAPGRPVMYGTTREFLKIFQLGSIADLPGLDEVEEEKFAEHN